MASETNYAWHKSSNGRWERNLDEAEIFYAALQKLFEGSGRMFFAITGHAALNVVGDLAKSLTEQQLDLALQKAWLLLRSSHPSIAVSTVFDPQRKRLKKTYNAVDINQHEEWLEATFRVISTEHSGLEWCNSDPPAPEMATLFIVKSSRDSSALSRTIVLRSPHDVVDGIGTLHILGTYLKHLSAILERSTNVQPQWSAESEMLTPPLRVAADLPDRAPDNVQTALEMAQQRSSTMISEGPSVMSVPCPREAATPLAHQRAALCLPSTKTTAIIQRCKDASVSITHAYHAAAAIVLARRQLRFEKERRVQYVSYALVNLREQCRAPFNGPAHAASVYHCTSAEKFGIQFTIPARDGEVETAASDFPRVLSEIKAYYVANRPSTQPMLLKIAPLLWDQATPHIPEEAWTKPYVMSLPPANPAPSISMSSFGIIDRMVPTQIGDLNVHNPWVTGEELGPGIGLFLGTFRGELELSAAFNAAWHDVSEIDGYLNDIQGVVEEGLGLSSS